MMKQISTRLLTVLGLCMFFLSACNNSSDFTVKGVVAGLMVSLCIWKMSESLMW